MKISKIEPQKKNKKRSSIYVDGKFAFGLSNEIILKYDLNEGDDIDDSHIKDVLLEEEKQKIRQRAFKLLQYRNRSVRELTGRLTGIGFDQRLVDSVMQEFINDKVVDDEKFARAFVSDYTLLNPRGNRFISRELGKRGVSIEIISKILHQRNERDIIKAFIAKKLSHLDKHDPKERQKIMRRLLTRGFSPDSAYEVLNEPS